MAKGLLEITGKNKNIVLIKENAVSGAKLVMRGSNIVTTAGEYYYAEMVCSTDPTDDFDNSTAGIHLGNGTTGGESSTHTDVNSDDVSMYNVEALESGYPKVSCTYTENTGSGANVITWHYYWSTTEGTGTGLNEGAIVNSLTGATAALTVFDIGSTFDKTASDTLRIFINHTVSGTG